MQDIHDVLPPLPLVHWHTYVWLIVGALILGLIIYAYCRRSKKVLVIEKSLSAYEKAMLGLDQLAGQSLPDAVFAVHVSHCVRVFLEQHLSEPVTEQTTEEFLAAIHDAHWMTFEMTESLGAFLEACDLAKFAKEPISSYERSELIEQAKTVIDRIFNVTA